MTKETKYFIEEIKQEARINEIMKERLIAFDTFFKDSGKIEKQTKSFYQGETNYSNFVDKPEEYIPLPSIKQLQIHNDMSRYVLKNNLKIEI